MGSHRSTTYSRFAASQFSAAILPAGTSCRYSLDSYFRFYEGIGVGDAYLKNTTSKTPQHFKTIIGLSEWCSTIGGMFLRGSVVTPGVGFFGYLKYGALTSPVSTLNLPRHLTVKYK
ncbi:hypothetical protein LSTR_LSTR016423 [Laodelphax striatellus]|uniref:Uncharacterized protein n=1 Tax=Laodelphax striatellus TaxID=195883 RepID=A0A482WZG3_LAOST|nr:hypothetical protein LSTR_LSTR016423 [Laodelphax striatellus]